MGWWLVFWRRFDMSRDGKLDKLKLIGIGKGLCLCGFLFYYGVCFDNDVVGDFVKLNKF